MLFLPAHDEGARVAAVIERMPSHVCGRPTRCLVVDDGSDDDTSTAAAAAGAHVVRHRTNRGLGAAVRTGLAAAVELDAAVIAFCDADGEYDPAELALLVEPILAGEADYVVGSRFAGTIDRMRPHRRAGNVVLTAAFRWICRAPISDGQSGYRAFSRDAAARASVAHDYNYAQVLTIDMLSKGFGYREVPIHYAFRASGTSFVRLGRYLRSVVPTVYRQLNDGPPASLSTPSVLDHMVAEPLPRDTPGGAVEPSVVVDH
ncbi:MAG: glycosyltransferase [Actinomycetota bacterium]|nr:glycosyltransferase [Actinomycetota bacterium]